MTSATTRRSYACSQARTAFAPRLPVSLSVRSGRVVAGHALAKFLEMRDTEIYLLTGELMSGHTLKHLAAAAAVLPVLDALRRV